MIALSKYSDQFIMPDIDPDSPLGRLNYGDGDSTQPKYCRNPCCLSTTWSSYAFLGSKEFLYLIPTAIKFLYSRQNGHFNCFALLIQSFSLFRMTIS